MSPPDLSTLFDGAPRRRLPVGAILFRRGDPVTEALWLVHGRVRLVRATEGGGLATLQTCDAPGWIAEASLFSELYHCDAEAVTGIELRRRPKAAFVKGLAGDADQALAAMAHLARELRAARMRAEILTLRTVAERLDAWTELVGGKSEAQSWASVAAEIGVSPEALYRELARRRASGRISGRASA